MLVNDVRTGRGNPDHVLVGPADVFLLETKNLGGTVSVERGVLAVRWLEDSDDGYEARQIASTGGSARRALKESVYSERRWSVGGWKASCTRTGCEATGVLGGKIDEIIAVLRSSLRSWSELG